MTAWDGWTFRCVFHTIPDAKISSVVDVYAATRPAAVVTLRIIAELVAARY